MKAKIVNEWFATNPTEHQKNVVQRYVHQVMFLFFILGVVVCIGLFFLIGVMIA